MSEKMQKVKKQLLKRRKQLQQRMPKEEKKLPLVFQRHEEARDEPDFYVYAERKEEGKQLTIDRFVLKMFVAVGLFFATAILFHSESPKGERLRSFVSETFEKEFQFAKIANWYEAQFGRPLALLPFEANVALKQGEGQSELVYAVPASGTIAETFETNGTGVIVETERGALVEAAKAGFIFYIGEDEELGKTVAVQHYDGGESWYGMLEQISVKLYDHIESGTAIGTVSTADEAGKYYFALKQGETYIDPIDVISFE